MIVGEAWYVSERWAMTEKYPLMDKSCPVWRARKNFQRLHEVVGVRAFVQRPSGVFITACNSVNEQPSLDFSAGNRAAPVPLPGVRAKACSQRLAPRSPVDQNMVVTGTAAADVFCRAFLRGRCLQGACRSI
jgi:hypothetical protein